MESKQSRNEKENKRKQFCDQMIVQESVYIRNAYYSGILDLYKLFVWYSVNYEIIIDRKIKELMPKSTREAIKNARRGEKRSTKELLYSPIVVNKYKIDKVKRDVFTGKLKNKNLKGDLSPELSMRMIYEYANKSQIMELFSPKELFYIYCMAYVDDEAFFNAILDSDNVVEAIKMHITLNKDSINNRLEGFDAEKILNLSKSTIYNYLVDLKLKKTIKVKKESEIYQQLSNNLYEISNMKTKKVMVFVISEISRGEEINIVSYRYGGMNERTNNLRSGKLECRNIEEDVYSYLLNKAGIQKNTVVIDYTNLKGENKLKRTMNFLARFKYNIFIKEKVFVK